MAKAKKTETLYAAPVQPSGYGPPPLNTFSVKVKVQRPGHDRVLDYYQEFAEFLSGQTVSVSQPVELDAGSFTVKVLAGEDLAGLWNRLGLIEGKFSFHVTVTEIVPPPA